MFLFNGAWGLNTLTSTKVLSCLPPQKPFAAMSSQALSVVMAVRLAMVSEESGWRSGSTHTSLQTSVIRVAVRSLISLWRIDGNPPREQERACSIVKFTPQTQFVAVFGGHHPYLRARASINAPLCRQNPCSSRPRQRLQPA